MASTRRLAAILAADVAGYSRLMGLDEEGTHERLQAHFRELVNPKIAEHRGRTVKNTGDGLLAEFPSVVDAVRCAVEIQRGDREPDVPEERRIRFRIGVNMGDVIVEEHDIFGDGVNVAARLEGLAEPGGICISRVVRDQIRDKLPYPFEDLGEQSVKNIARPVRVYVWRPEGVADLSTTSVPIAVPTRHRRTILAPIGAAFVTVLVIAGVTWWFWPTTRSSPTGTPAVAATTSIARPLVAPRLSIVVLPFANLSQNPEQQYFADGITEDLTTDLSRIAHIFVISRNTAFTYKDKPINAKEIGHELGVRYVLEGSVQRLGGQVRVNAQLIDAETDAHLWAERFDHDAGDLSAVQNEITGRIANSLNLRLASAEAARPTDNPDALDYILRGRAIIGSNGISPEFYSQAIAMYERALAIEPLSAEARTYLGQALASRALSGMSNSRASDIARAKALIEEAIAMSPRSTYAHYAKGQLLRAEGRCDEAISELEMVVASDPNYAAAFFALGVCKLATGSIGEAIPLEEQAIRLSPRDPVIYNRYLVIGQVHLLQSRTDEAIVWLKKARAANPASQLPHAWLASAFGLKGDQVRAAAELAEVRRLGGERSCYSSIACLGKSPSMSKIRPLYEATYLAGLRKAGVPEE